MSKPKYENLLGQTFSKLTVIKFDQERYIAKKKPFWICKCNCEDGIEKSVSAANLKQGTVKSCGCMNRQIPANFRDLTGQKFGEWTAIKRAPNRGRNTYWLCSCSCGKTVTEVKQVDLIQGKSKKCGHCTATEIHAGDKFGTWTVLSYEGTNKHRSGLYKCACDCGQTIKIIEYGALVFRNYPKCNKCRQRQIESVHATVLKQIWKYYRPLVKWEEIGCINPNTGKSLDTDIVDHELKISVEVQSHYHDEDYQKEKDEIKKKYWESLGYKHYQVDMRDYSVLEMVQIFFPKITAIPEWVDKSGKITNRKWSYLEAQICLNNGLSYKETAEKVGTTKCAISNAISLGNLIKLIKIKIPKILKIKIREAKVSVVQLSLNDEYIKIWESQSEAYRNTNIDSSSISACCKGKLKTAGKFKWMRLADYEQLNNEQNQEAI